MTAAIAVQDGTEATGTFTSRPHFAGFEILRAASAFMILAHHAASYAGPERTGRLRVLFESFEIAVPVFFVTSGFLIFRPLVTAHFVGSSGPRLVDFWWRRMLRVVPAYWLALTFWWLVGNFELGDDWWRYYLFLQIYDRYTVFGGIVQAWTLATEVAFYLAIPLWAILVGRLARRLRSANQVLALQLTGCAILWAGAVVARATVDHYAPHKSGLTFTWLPMNLDPFAWGMGLAAVSVWSMQNPRARAALERWGRPVGLWWSAAIAVMLWYGYVIGPATDYHGWFWQRRQLVFLLGGVLAVIPAAFGPARGGSFIRRFWGARPLVWLGSISYALYLWHFDIIKRGVAAGVHNEFHDYELWPGWLGSQQGDTNLLHLLLLGVVGGVLCAAVSWHVVEKPLSRFRKLFARTGTR